MTGNTASSLERLRPLGFVAVTALVMLLPWLGLDSYWVRQLLLVAILSLVVSGLSLSFGFAGELALGQAAVYAAGAYAAGYVAVNVVNDVLVASLIASAVAVVVGLVAGAPGIRLGGWMLAIGSFFLVLLVPDIVSIVGDPIGGLEGLTGIPLPELFGQELTDNGYYVFAVLVAAVWFGLFRNLIASPRGAEFRVLGAGKALSHSLGVSTYVLKLKAYAIGAVPAGLAGCLFAYLDGYVSTGSFGLNTTLLILAAGVLGGLQTVYGAILGAALLQLGPTGSTAFQDYATVAFGAFLLIGGVFLPRGITPLITRLVKRILPAGRPSGTSTDARTVVEFAPVAGGTLRAQGITKFFGGNRALDDVNIDAKPGRITALIGPNGSGKTTLLNVVSGYYTASEGTLSLNDESIGALKAHLRARRGIGRTFQMPNIPKGLSVREVVRSGSLSAEVGMLATVLRLPAFRRRERVASREVDLILGALGLSRHAREEAASLPLGTRRLVELGRALALQPAVLLLDEVASGLDTEEIEELRVLLERLRRAGATVILVEHNFDLVRAVADDVYVLAEGKLLAAGGPEEIAANEAVRTIYLGAGPPDRTRGNTASDSTLEGAV